MSNANTLDAVPTSPHKSRGSGIVIRMLPAAVVLLATCGLVATAMLDGSADVPLAPRLIPTPTAAPAVAATDSTTVPDASTVFAGREIEVEEPTPTF